ncbi:MAG: hypothetical protein COA42_17460, partial [Alteromonadaceae bacterium]
MLSGIEIEGKPMQPASDLKSFVHELAEQVPSNATLDALDDVIARLVERREIEVATADIEAGRTVDGDTVMAWLESWGTENEKEP